MSGNPGFSRGPFIGRRPLLRTMALAALTASAVTRPRLAEAIAVEGATGGTSDMTATINAMIASAPDGSVVTLPRGQDLRVDGTIRLPDRRGLVLEGNGARLYSTLTTPLSTKPVIPMIEAHGGTDITIQNLTMQGTNPTADFEVRREWQPLIGVRGVQGMAIRGVTGIGSWGDFVHLAPDTRPEQDVLASNVEITGCQTRRIGRNQVSLTGCTDIDVHDNRFGGTGYQVFDIEVQAPWWRASRISIRNNLIGGKVSLSVLVCATSGIEVSDVEFTNNEMTVVPSSCEPPILLVNKTAPKRAIRVTNNVLRTLSNAARLSGVENVALLDNQLTQYPGGGCRYGRAAVLASASNGIQIQGNTVRGSYDEMVRTPLDDVTGLVSCGNHMFSALGAPLQESCV